MGISLKDQSRIFNRFERSAAAARSSKGGATGFGLGLNYVQQVMLAHEGRVEVESEEGRFSEFTLYFPARSRHYHIWKCNSCEQSLMNASLPNERSFQRMQMSSMLPINKNVPNNVK